MKPAGRSCWVVALFLLLATALGSAACSRPETPPPPGKLSADQVAGALGGVPHRSTRRGPTAVVPDEFLEFWEPWTGVSFAITPSGELRLASW